MSEHFIGQVAKLYTRTGTSKGKSWTSHSFKLKGADGKWLNPFFRLSVEPKCKEGDWIQFDADPIDENAMQVVKGTVRSYTPPEPAPATAPEPVKQEEAKPAAPSKGKSSYVSEKQSREEYWDNKEKRDIEHTQPRINFQAARNAAIAVVQVLSENKALPISAAEGKAGTSKRYEQIIDIVNKLAVQFHHDTNTLRLLDTVADAGAVSVPNPGALPEDATEEQTQSAADSADDGGSW